MGVSMLIGEGVCDPSCVETIACREAICLGQDIQMGVVVIASDCA